MKKPAACINKKICGIAQKTAESGAQAPLFVASSVDPVSEQFFATAGWSDTDWQLLAGEQAFTFAGRKQAVRRLSLCPFIVRQRHEVGALRGSAMLVKESSVRMNVHGY